MLILSILLAEALLVFGIPLNERVPKSISPKAEVGPSMKAIHGPTSSIIDFRRACVITYQVDPDKKLDSITEFDDEVPIGSLNECAYLCYQSACRNAIFEPGTPGNKGKCKVSSAGHEDCAGRLQRHYNFKTTSAIVLSCVRCVGERPVTLTPDALFPRPTHFPTLIEETTTATITNLETEAPTTVQIELTTAGEELPPADQEIKNETITDDLLANSTNTDIIEPVAKDVEKTEESEIKNAEGDSKLKLDENLKLKDDIKIDTLLLEQNTDAIKEAPKEEQQILEEKKEILIETTPENKEEASLDVEKKEIIEAKDPELEKEKLQQQTEGLGEQANANLTDIIEAKIQENLLNDTQNSTETEILTTLLEETTPEATTLEGDIQGLTTPEILLLETTLEQATSENLTLPEELTTESLPTSDNETLTSSAQEQPEPLSLVENGTSTFTTVSGSNESVDITTLATNNETLTNDTKSDLLEAAKQADVPLAESNDDLVKKVLEVVPTAAGVKTSTGHNDTKIEKVEEALNTTEVFTTEAHTTTKQTTLNPKTFDFQRGCLITFQADPLEERPEHFRSAFELIIETKAPEICATRCYQDGCTGSLYFPLNGTCILGYGDRHYCSKRPLVKFLKFSGSDELVWLHCVGCRSSRHGIQGEVLDFAAHSHKLKEARVSKLLSKPLFQVNLESNNSTGKTGSLGGPFGKTS